MNRSFYRFVFGAGILAATLSCVKEARNTEELVDPWLRERTPVNFRLESQIGSAVIADDWRDDGKGSVSVSLITGGLDLSAVKVEALDFKYPDSEFCPKADIGPGSTLDLSSGTASFTVTSYNGETRTYTVSYDQFTDPLEGTYTFAPISGILDGSAPKSSMVIIGGWDGAVVVSTVQDKYWHWGAGYQPGDEEDNVLSFRLEKADPETGATYGTLVNTAGADGKYANYVYNNTIDVNDRYRLFPEGKSRWAKPGDGSIVIYAYDDETYSTPLHRVGLMEPGTYEIEGKTLQTASKVFIRSFQGPFDVIDWNYPDTRWYTDNLRHVILLVNKDSDNPIADHSAFLGQ